MLLHGGLHALPFRLLPWAWLVIVYAIGGAAALHHRKPLLMLLAPAALLYVGMVCMLWLVHGLKALWNGREPQRDNPVRYANVAG